MAGAGPGVPALSCGARRLQVQFLLRRAPRSPRGALGPGAAEPARSLGAEDTPVLVEKTFPADSVVAAVAGSRGSDLSLPCRLRAPRRVSVTSGRASLRGPVPGRSGVRLAGTASPGEGSGPGRRPRARGGSGDEVRSAAGTRATVEREGCAARSREPSAVAGSSPQSSASFVCGP